MCRLECGETFADESHRRLRLLLLKLELRYTIVPSFGSTRQKVYRSDSSPYIYFEEFSSLFPSKRRLFVTKPRHRIQSEPLSDVATFSFVERMPCGVVSIRPRHAHDRRPERVAGVWRHGRQRRGMPRGSTWRNGIAI